MKYSYLLQECILDEYCTIRLLLFLRNLLSVLVGYVKVHRETECLLSLAELLYKARFGS